MEYPPASAGGVQSTYSQHPQDQTRISPGSNAQTSGSTFPVSEIGSHNRSYNPYPQSYQPPHEFGGSQGSHPTPNSPTYPQMYPNEGHGQSLTLNQLLQQGNTHGNYQARLSGQAPYRTYEQFPYGYKPGIPGTLAERSQNNTYLSYGGPSGHRYADPYGRPTYSNYPPGPAYPYYPTHMSQQSPQRHPIVPHSATTDYINTTSAATSPRPLQSTTSAGIGAMGDRPSSRNVGSHVSPSAAPSPAAHLSSPVLSGAAVTMPTSSWPSHAIPFASPQHPSHGQSHNPPLPRPQSGGRDVQQVKSLNDTYTNPHASVQLDRYVDSRTANQTEESGSPIQSRQSDNGRPSTANSCGSGMRESSEDPTGTEVMKTVGSGDNVLSSATCSMESYSSGGMSTFNASSTLSPAHLHRRTPPIQPPTSYTTTAAQTNPPTPPQPNQSATTQPISGTLGAPRLQNQPGQMFRSYGPPIQSPPGIRQSYSPCLQPQMSQQSPMHTVGSYLIGNRPHFYATGSHPTRPSMPTTPGLFNSASAPARMAVPPASHFSLQPSGTPGMMPPPAAPPPTASHPSPGNNTPVSQMGFINVPNNVGAISYEATVGATTGSGWESQSHPSSHSGGVPSALAQQHQQSYVQGRPSSVVYTVNPERGNGYSSPQPMAVAAAAATLSAGAPSSSSATYQHQHHHHPSIPVSYHHSPYPASQSLYPPHPYACGLGGSTLSPSTHHSNNSHTATTAPPPYPGMTNALPTRDPYHPQYGHPERSLHPYFGPSVSAMSTDQPAFSIASPSSTAMNLQRGNTMNANSGGSKISPCGMMVKSQKMDSGMRPVTPNSASLFSSNVSSSQSGMTSNFPFGPSGPADDGTNTAPPLMSQQAQLPDCVNQQHVPQSLHHHAFPPGYWPEGMIHNNPMNVPSTSGSHPFHPHQQQYYRGPSIPPQMHTQYPPHATMPHSVCGPIQTGGSVYGSGSMGPQPLPHGISPQSSGGFQKLLEMGSEPERRSWLEHYVRFMEDIGKPLVGLPQVVKQPLDLYRFYLAVRERGGVLEVIKTRRWKEISQLVNINASASAAYTLRKNYCKFLLDYECRFDRGGADPTPILMHIEAMSGKKKKASPGDTESGCGPNSSSLSGSSLQMPAPPSPTGSHSSASSSLLPPGSGSASLSGVPTAGSGASDSQLGPGTAPARLGDSSHTPSNMTLMEGTNGLPNSPASSSALSTRACFMSETSAASPQHLNSNTSTLNGYVNTSHNATAGATADGNARTSVSWPWCSDAGLVTCTAGGSQYPQSVTVNGFPVTTSSPLRGPLVTYTSQSSFDMGIRSHCTDSSHPKITPSAGTMTPMAHSTTSMTVTTLGMPLSFSPSVTNSFTPATKTTEPTVHHHSGGPYATPSSVSGVPAHSVLSHIPHSSGYVGVAPLPQSTMHSRLCMPTGFRPPPYGSGVVPPGSGDPVTLWCMQQFRSSTSGPVQSYPPPGSMSSYPGGTPSSNTSNVPAHLIHHHGQRSGYVATILKRVEHHPFPPGTIEATQIEPSRKRRYRSKDVGSIAPAKLLMALRSGMTAEVSWALNCLNILLRDEYGLEFLSPLTLPVLITHLVDLWRHSLGELFNHDVFVTSLELPADLTLHTRLMNSHDRSETKSKFFTTTRSHGMLSKIPRISVSPSNLSNLEREIISLASKRNISVSTLRHGIRRLLNKTNANFVSFLTPVRNGLLLRFEPLTTTSPTTLASTVTAAMTTDPSVASTHLRSRKRGKPQTHYTPTSPLTTTQCVPVSSCFSCTPSTHTTTLATDRSEMCGKTRVIMTSSCLGSPQSYSNLRELAHFVIDELADVHHKSSSDLKSSSFQAVPTSHFGYPSTPAKYLRDLISHGGGDTTCHIMPPFGASPYLSQHWCINLDGFDETEDFQASSTPPPFVVNEKCAVNDVTKDDHDEETGDLAQYDDTQPHCKRIRHTSTSSLSCPVLSPQALDELSADAPNSLSHTETDLIVSKHSGDRLSVCDTTDDEDSEFSQLIMDANGRCPLRAREELVYYGLTCLWPDSPATDCNEARAVRCLCVSTVLRNLSFLHLAEHHLSTHNGVLALIGRTMLLGHEHVGPLDTWQTVEMTAQKMQASLCAWRTPTWLEDMRENALVTLVNIAGSLDFIHFEESIVRPILEGLLHWIICPTAASIDPFPGHRTLSPRRLALEALNRLFVHQSNVDLLLSTPKVNDTDLTKFFDRLANWLSLPEDQVTRELALSTMHYLTGGGISFNGSNDSMPTKGSTVDASSTCFFPSNYIGTTMLAVAKPCPITGLLAFIEAAEATTRRVIEQFGVQALQERPELMGTSLEMVRRAGALLDRLAADPTGRKRFTPNLELRLMDLVTSRVLDATVAHLLCGALHRLSPTEPVVCKVVAPLVPPNPSPAVVAQLLKTAERKSSTDTLSDSKNCAQSNSHQDETSTKRKSQENGPSLEVSPQATPELILSGTEDTTVTNNTDNSNQQCVKVGITKSLPADPTSIKSETVPDSTLMEVSPSLLVRNCVDT